jgi:hypothetical protein
MAIRQLSFRSTVVTSAAAAAEIRCASGARANVLEVGLVLGAATASTYGLGFPAAVGITPTAPITFLSGDPDNTIASNVTSAVAWGTGPTVPANFYRRASLAGTIGQGIIWTFPRNTLWIAAPGAAAVSSMVVWNLATNSAVLDIWVVVDE